MIHSFRRFDKTTISDLGYADYSIFYRTCRFYILTQKGFRKSRDIPENRAISNLPKYTSAGKTGRRHTDHGRGIGGFESVA